MTLGPTPVIATWGTRPMKVSGGSWGNMTYEGLRWVLEGMLCCKLDYNDKMSAPPHGGHAAAPTSCFQLPMMRRSTFWTFTTIQNTLCSGAASVIWCGVLEGHVAVMCSRGTSMCRSMTPLCFNTCVSILFLTGICHGLLYAKWAEVPPMPAQCAVVCSMVHPVRLGVHSGCGGGGSVSYWPGMVRRMKMGRDIGY